MRTAIEAQQDHYGFSGTAEREKSIPLARVSLPDDIARIAAFLASDESSYMTGESINLYGGLLMD
jgi:3-oxoacyl-[acyl-carrier protein] reductase